MDKVRIWLGFKIWEFTYIFKKKFHKEFSLSTVKFQISNAGPHPRS